MNSWYSIQFFVLAFVTIIHGTKCMILTNHSHNPLFLDHLDCEQGKWSFCDLIITPVNKFGAWLISSICFLKILSWKMMLLLRLGNKVITTISLNVTWLIYNKANCTRLISSIYIIQVDLIFQTSGNYIQD